MIIARNKEEKDLIKRITPLYAVKEGYIISAGDSIYLKRDFASFATSSMSYAPDYYVEERIANKLIKVNYCGLKPTALTRKAA